MILIDSSNVMIANATVMMKDFGDYSMSIEKGDFEVLILNALLNIRKKLKNETEDDEIVLCFDSRDTWRKKAFPYYKGMRKSDKQKSGINWANIHENMNHMEGVLRNHFPYKCISSPEAEADDVIGTLCYEYGDTDKEIIIVSRDMDFFQLQKFSNVRQFNNSQNKFMGPDDPDKYLLEHILRGDRGDGIPNFLSKDSVFVEADERQKQIRVKKMEIWLQQRPSQICETADMQYGFKRNEMLIDLSFIPENIKNNILAEYEKPAINNRSDMMMYLAGQGHKKLVERVREF